MATKLFFHNSFSDRQEFSLKNGSRPWHAMILISKGSFSFTIQEKEFIIRENEIAFFPKDIVFSRAILKPIDFHQFGFHDEGDTSHLPSPDCGKLNLPQNYVASLLDMLQALKSSEIKSRNIIYQNTVDHILLANHVYSERQSANQNTDKDIEFVVEYMCDHLNEKINMHGIAEGLHLTHTGLIGKFKRIYHCSPNEYLIKMRMKLAKNLIAEGEMRINEISDMCGYSNAYYFSAAFRKYTGITPTEYRRSLKNSP